MTFHLRHKFFYRVTVEFTKRGPRGRDAGSREGSRYSNDRRGRGSPSRSYGGYARRDDR